MKAMIFEPAYRGHHLHYVRVLTQGLMDLGVEVAWALSSDAPESDEFRVHLASLRDGVRLSTPTAGIQSLGYRSWKKVGGDLFREVRATRPDRVFLPYTGGLTAALGRQVRPWPFPDTALEGLVMRGGWAYPQPELRAKVRQAAILRMIRRIPWARLHILDPLAYCGMRNRGVLDPRRHVLIPEPVEPMPSLSTSEARTRLGLPNNGRWAVVVGQQDKRKGTDRLLEAFLRADTPAEARLLLAGTTSPDIHAWVRVSGKGLVKQGKLVLMDRYLSEDELSAALHAADLIVAPHFRPVGSSGLLVRAAAIRKPVLATDYGWVGWATRTFNLGRTVDIENPQAYADALTAAFNQLTPFGNDLTPTFVKYHTLNNHLQHWLSGTRVALGIKGNEARVEWPTPYLDSSYRT